MEVVGVEKEGGALPKQQNKGRVSQNKGVAFQGKPSKR